KSIITNCWVNVYKTRRERQRQREREEKTGEREREREGMIGALREREIMERERESISCLERRSHMEALAQAGCCFSSVMQENTDTALNDSPTQTHTHTRAH